MVVAAVVAAIVAMRSGPNSPANTHAPKPPPTELISWRRDGIENVGAASGSRRGCACIVVPPSHPGVVWKTRRVHSKGAVGDPCFFDASLTGGGNDGRSIHFNFRGARVLGELTSVSRWSLPRTVLACNVADAFVAVAFVAVALVAVALVAVAFARPCFVATGGSAAVTVAGFDLATLGLTASTAADWESVFEADLDATLKMALETVLESTLETPLESTLETDSVFALADFFAG